MILQPGVMCDIESHDYFIFAPPFASLLSFAHDTPALWQTSTTLHFNTAATAAAVCPLMAHCYQLVITSVFQEIFEGALDSKKESIQQHGINVVNISFPDAGCWVCCK